MPGFSHFYLVCLQGKNFHTNLSDSGDEAVWRNCPSLSRNIDNSSDANFLHCTSDRTKEKLCDKCSGFWSRNGSYVNTQGPQCSLESREIWEKWQSAGKWINQTLLWLKEATLITPSINGRDRSKAFGTLMESKPFQSSTLH